MKSSAKNNLLGVFVDGVNSQTAIDMVMEAAKQGRSFSVSALAVHGVMSGMMDITHRYRLNHLDLVVADGQPVRWALNLLYAVGLRERVYGPRLTLDVIQRAADEGVPVYLYGNTQEVLTLLCARLRQRFPKIQIVGAEPSQFARIIPETADRIAARIKQSGAQIVFVGLGCPRQEVWAYEFRDRLKLPILAVGAAFPLIAGTLRMAPKWMQDHGLEWLFRLRMEPRRLWRRYLLLGPAYVVLVLGQWIGVRFDTEGKAPEREVLYG